MKMDIESSKKITGSTKITRVLNGFTRTQPSGIKGGTAQSVEDRTNSFDESTKNSSVDRTSKTEESTNNNSSEDRTSKTEESTNNNSSEDRTSKTEESTNNSSEDRTSKTEEPSNNEEKQQIWFVNCRLSLYNIYCLLGKLQ
jgi:cobalamin biosynthesis protein CobT